MYTDRCTFKTGKISPLKTQWEDHGYVRISGFFPLSRFTSSFPWVPQPSIRMGMIICFPCRKTSFLVHVCFASIFYALPGTFGWFMHVCWFEEYEGFRSSEKKDNWITPAFFHIALNVGRDVVKFAEYMFNPDSMMHTHDPGLSCYRNSNWTVFWTVIYSQKHPCSQILWFSSFKGKTQYLSAYGCIIPSYFIVHFLFQSLLIESSFSLKRLIILGFLNCPRTFTFFFSFLLSCLSYWCLNNSPLPPSIHSLFATCGAVSLIPTLITSITGLLIRHGSLVSLLIFHFHFTLQPACDHVTQRLPFAYKVKLKLTILAFM